MSNIILDKKNMLAMPDGLSTRGKLAYQLIMDRLTRFKITTESTGGCRAFYSPSEWEERGEEHGKGAVLIIVYEGSDVKYHFNMDRASEMKRPYNTTEKMQEILNKEGLHYSECTGWYAAVYDDRKVVEKRETKAIVKGDSGHSPYLVGVAWKKLLTGLVGKRVKITIEEVEE